jgi:hypothetical protein
VPGPAPKPAHQRRRRTAPAGGEWVELPAELDAPILPPLPRRKEGKWSPRTRDTWEAWRRDPATSQYTAADVRYALDTVYLIEHANRSSQASLHAEIRLRLDGLGLTAKGKRNLRWRVSPPGEVIDFPQTKPKSGRRRERLMRAVDPDEIP